MWNKKMILSGVLLTVAVVGQIALTLWLYNDSGNTTIRNLGWILLWISAIFGWLPIVTMRKWGGVSKGESYVATTTLVDRGVYAVVRHPQYTSGLLMGGALSLIAQHWAVWIPGVLVAALSYAATWQEEIALRKKFGQAYEDYQQRVPRVNFILGLLRLLVRSNP
jgi:protein-S-isoprenylcysteine O-methyltransferase Ste14